FVVYNTSHNSGPRVDMVTSADGKSWSGAIRVDTQPNANAILPWAAAGGGRLCVGFYHQPYDFSQHLEFHTACAATSEAPTFTEFRVSTQVTSYRDRSLFLGDYTGMAVGGDGIFHPGWTDSRDSVKPETAIFSARLDFSHPQQPTAV